MNTKKKSRLSKNSGSFLLLSLVLLANSCAVQIPNTRFCAVAGVVEGGMDCFHTLSDEEETIAPLEIRNFLEAMPEIKDAKGKVIQVAHAAAICQPMEDWSKEHEALESACTKLGASCTYEIKKMIQNVTGKVNELSKAK